LVLARGGAAADQRDPDPRDHVTPCASVRAGFGLPFLLLVFALTGVHISSITMDRSEVSGRRTI
ncbi:MAG: hypothetical protein ACRDC0_01260, partial [Aeromonas veronii]